MANLPIRIRLILLSGALLVFLFATNFYLDRKLAENSAEMSRTGELLGIIHDINEAQVAYGQLRYWLTDLAVSLLSSSEEKAAVARERMEADLDRLALQQPQAVAAIRRDLERYEDYAGRAVEVYTAGDRTAGNKLLAQGTEYSMAVDRRLVAIAGELSRQSADERRRLIAEATLAQRLSRVIVWAAVLTGGLLTLLVLRSIVGPLRRLSVAMDGLNAGNVAVAIPAAGPDEIGAMARTLGAFRDTLEALRSALAQFEALRDVGRAVASTLDLDVVLNLIVARAVEFSHAQAGVVYEYDRAVHEFSFRTSFGAEEPVVERLRQQSIGLGEGGIGRAAATAASVQLPDLRRGEELAVSGLSEILGDIGYRSVLAVPLLHEEEILGGLVILRVEAGAFSKEVVGLVEAFAAQSAIAVRNAKLFEAQLDRESELRAANEQLKAAQASLIQAEKMASLGQLTAGIAHEIKNPLNFVNNFAELSRELLDELGESVAAFVSKGATSDRREIDELLTTLRGNMTKIAEHGRRADGIVKSMLSHSRGGGGERGSADLNTLVEEALGLAYHGVRAQDPGFNVTLERDYEPDLGLVELVPQDITRVLLNLYGNGFYAADKRRRESGDPAFEPVLRVTTRSRGEAVEIRVRDNGIGIAPEVRANLFTPFFTTKPTGEGTGLGLSISYDIIVQGHGGTIDVDSERGVFAEFTLRLPRRWSGAAAAAAAGASA
jgi:signal transduction histidine kinase/HAMP domain-containing protein